MIGEVFSAQLESFVIGGIKKQLCERYAKIRRELNFKKTMAYLLQ